MQEQIATIDGTPVRWLEQGSGTPVVLVHGIPTSPALWRRVVPRLTGMRVLALEMTGYGQSIPAGEGREISVAAQAARLLRWLEHLHIDRAVLVGHDLGGGVVQIAAVHRPPVCAGLLITNGIAYDSWPIPSVKAMQAVSPLLATLPPAALKPAIGMLIARGHDDRSVAKESLDVHYRPYAEHGGGAAMARQVRSLKVQDTIAVQDQLPSLRLPARIVWGVADQFQKIAFGERLAQDLEAPLRRIEGGKHFTPEDHPDVIAEEITSLVGDAE